MIILTFVKDNKITITIICIVILIVIFEFILLNDKSLSILILIVLIIKILYSLIKINYLNNYYPDDNIQNIIRNTFDIISNPNNKLTDIFINYLPILIFNGLLMIILYVIVVSKLRVELSLSNNCRKSNYTVEYTTLRKKINTFSRNNDAILKSYLIISIICFLLAILTIFYLLYNSIIEIQYVILVPILIFLIIFASIIIDKIDKNIFKSINDPIDLIDNNVIQEVFHYLKIILIPFITFFSISFIIK